MKCMKEWDVYNIECHKVMLDIIDNIITTSEYQDRNIN